MSKKSRIEKARTGDVSNNPMVYGLGISEERFNDIFKKKPTKKPKNK